MSTKPTLKVTRKTSTFLKWPTETFGIDFCAPRSFSSSSTSAFADAEDASRLPPHTILVFIPGNPGLIDWYIPFFTKIIDLLGPGYAARGVANAGHSVADADLVDVEHWTSKSGQRDTAIPWTVDGQVLHKLAYMDYMMEEINLQNILRQTSLLIHLMPFIRMKAPPMKQMFLDTAASSPGAMVSLHKTLMKAASFLPETAVSFLISSLYKIDDPEAGVVAGKLVRQPAFAANFFELGTEEIRDAPQIFDAPAMRFIGKFCDTRMLFAGDDQWSPDFHIQDLLSLQQKGLVPRNVTIRQRHDLRHDFVTTPVQNAIVVDLCVSWIRDTVEAPTSKL